MGQFAPISSISDVHGDSLRLFQAAVGTDHRKIDDEIEFLIRIIEEKPSFWSLKDRHSVSLFEDKIKF